MNVKEELLRKKEELLEKNSLYNENLSRINDLNYEIDNLNKTKKERLEESRRKYWIICLLLMTFQVLINLHGVQHLIAIMGININALFLSKRRDAIFKEIETKENELVDLENETNDLYDLVWELREEVHRLTEEVKNIPDNILDEEIINEVNEALEDVMLYAGIEEPKKLMLTY